MIVQSCSRDYLSRQAGDSTRESLHFEIMENYPSTADNKTLMAKYLTPEIYEQYWNIETQSGFSFDHLIQSGIDVPQFSNCGFIAGDEECYETFNDFTDPILTEKHNGFIRGIHQHTACLDPSQLSKRCSMFDPNYIESVTFTAGRSIHGYRFLSACNRAERREIEGKFKNIFKCVSTRDGVNFSGEYYQIGRTSYDIIRNFPPDSPTYWMEKPTAPVYTAAGITRDWPDARGIFVSSCPGVFASVNRDNHLRLFCRENSADVTRAFTKFSRFHAEVEERMLTEGLKFARNEGYGYLLWYPSVIGTGLKVCMTIKLPLLSQNGKLFEIMRRLRLRFHFAQQPERAQIGWIDIYNGDRLGLTETDIVELVVDGAHKLIVLEKQLERSQSIEYSLPMQKYVNFDERRGKQPPQRGGQQQHDRVNT